MEYDVEIRRLSPSFYQTYPQDLYPEILKKGARPYTCLLIDTHEDYFICIPFRSEMKHSYGYHFNGTQRSSKSRSGLDYQKIVLINKTEYIDDAPAVVDQDEYTSVMRNLSTIISGAISYVEGYVNHRRGTCLLHEREFTRRYRYSTLPYFHDILQL